jgi:hypothetical protein
MIKKKRKKEKAVKYKNPYSPLLIPIVFQVVSLLAVSESRTVAKT